MEDFKNINVDVNFIDGPYVSIKDNHSEVYLVEIYERLGDEWGLIYSNHEFKPYTWFRYLRKFRTKWKIRVWGMENKMPTLLYQNTYNEDNKNIILRFDYPNYDVNFKWLLMAEKFGKKFNCNVIVESKFSERLLKQYKGNVKIIGKEENFEEYCQSQNIYAAYSIGRFDIQSNTWDFWESKGIFENHASHYDSWHHPLNWIKFSNEELFNNILDL